MKIAEKIRTSFDEENIVKEIMDLRFRLLMDQRMSEGELRLVMAYIDLITGICHDSMHLEYAGISSELAYELGALEKEKGH